MTVGLKTILMLVVVTEGAYALAAKKYEARGTCGSVEVIGQDCKTASVQFKFDGCLLKEDAQTVKNLTCDGNSLRASFEKNGFFYDSLFTMAESGGWGKKEWKGSTKLLQYQSVEVNLMPKAAIAVAKNSNSNSSIQNDKSPGRDVASAKNANIKKSQMENAQRLEPQGATSSATPPPQALLVASTLGTAEAPAGQSVQAVGVANPEVVKTNQEERADSPYKISGFFDFRFSVLEAKEDPSVLDANAESGFNLSDGALYMNYDKQKTSIVVDIPFRRFKDNEPSVLSSNQFPNQSSNNNIAVGVDHTQFYARYKANKDFSFVLGQFDTLYGVELNDSKDRMFNKTGLVYDLELPVTHAGFMIEWAKQGYTAKLFGANPNNKGSFGQSATGDTNTEYGMSFGYSNDNWRFQYGHMVRGILTADSQSKAQRTLQDVTCGSTFDQLSVDLEFALLDEPNKNSLTPSDLNDREQSAIGVFSLVTYKFDDEHSIGLRIENVANDPGGLGLKKSQSQGLSVHSKISSEIEVSAEVINYQYIPLNGLEFNDHRFSLGAIVQF